jgi:hypothetical protein
VLLLAAVLFVLSLWMPLVIIHLDPQFPNWLPDLLGAHDRLRKWLIDSADVPTGPQYLLQIIRDLAAHREWGLMIMVTIFSVLFPVAKISTGLLLTAGNRMMPEVLSRHLLYALVLLGKWSMADIFVIGFLIMSFKVKAIHFQYEAGAGLFAYATATLLTAAATSLICRHHAALRRHRRNEMVYHLFGRGRELRDAPGGDAVRQAAVFLRDEPL